MKIAITKNSDYPKFNKYEYICMMEAENILDGYEIGKLVENFNYSDDSIYSINRNPLILEFKFNFEKLCIVTH